MTRAIPLAAVLAVAGGCQADVILTNDLAVLTLDDAARVTSLVVRADGRELIGKPHPSCTALGTKGLAVGLVAARRADLVPVLRKMTETAGAPHTVNGGAWSLGAEGNRGSYCFADLWAFSVNDWVDFALRGGFSTIHLHSWWRRFGHYDFYDSQFPKGLTDQASTT